MTDARNHLAVLRALGDHRDACTLARVANDAALSPDAAAGALRVLRSRGWADTLPARSGTPTYWHRTRDADYVLGLLDAATHEGTVAP